MLKLSVAVHSSLVKFLPYQLPLHDIWHCHSNCILTCQTCQISPFLREFFVFFSSFLGQYCRTNQFKSIHESFPLPEKIEKSNWAGESNMADLMTSCDVEWRQYQQLNMSSCRGSRLLSIEYKIIYICLITNKQTKTNGGRWFMSYAHLDRKGKGMKKKPTNCKLLEANCIFLN